MLDAKELQVSGLKFQVEIEKIKKQISSKPLIVILNKVDLLSKVEVETIRQQLETLNLKLQTISAKNKTGIDELKIRFFLL